MTNLPISPASQAFIDALKSRVLVLDGAMGTMIQTYNLSENDYHGGCHCCSHSHRELKGCNDMLVLSRPDVIEDIHLRYLRAGADIIETDSFNANAISLEEYGLSDEARRINLEAARVACSARDRYYNETGRLAWVAGSMGPTSKSLTMAANLGDDIDFDTLRNAYRTQAEGLIEGGVDLLLIETCYDALNAKAALVAAEEAMEKDGRQLPVVVSITLDSYGRTLSGMALSGFIATVESFKPLAIGVNCGFGAEDAVKQITPLADAPTGVALYPNAGLPNELGEYDQTPQEFVDALKPLIESGCLNIVGGCCGTTPDHISALAKAVDGKVPRVIPYPTDYLVLSGLEPLSLNPDVEFVKIGERCNVAGSRKFLRLIKEENYDEALEIARKQIEDGAQIIDVNMDDGMLDTPECMSRFLKLAATDPVVARVPVMIDSSDFNVVTASLRLIQGKPVVNSISLKEGEQEFKRRAAVIHSMGAAMVVMAFDEQGQAVTPERRIEVCRRSYDILTREVGIPPSDIIFDPNILAVATGIAEHDSYGADFIKATEWITRNLPGCNVSGGLSNLSFSFRGNDTVRRAMHSIFIDMGRKAGMRMAIVNPAGLIPVESIPEDLREAVTRVLENSAPDATEQLISVAQKYQPLSKAAATEKLQQATITTEEALMNKVMFNAPNGNLEDLLTRVMEQQGSAINVIDNVLMKAMDKVGQRFGAGEIFLPQVVKSATVMKECITFLTPYIEQQRGKASASRGFRMVLATVKGDVHDIGKNIVAVVMRCNSFDVIDLGVMADPQQIIDVARRQKADCIGVSGLITPSLTEMTTLATMMEQEGLRIPLFVGGATTSPLHTAVKIAPNYSGAVIHTTDAADLASKAKLFLDPATAPQYINELKHQQQILRNEHAKPANLLTPEQARKLRPALEIPQPERATEYGSHRYNIPVSELTELVNMRQLLHAWGIKAVDYDTPEAKNLISDAREMLAEWSREGVEMKAVLDVVGAAAKQDDEIRIYPYGSKLENLSFPAPRQLKLMETTDYTLSLADYLPREKGVSVPVILFVVTATEYWYRNLVQNPQSYKGMMADLLLHRLAEAATEYVHRKYAHQLAGYPADMKSIRPAIGYPSLPDQHLTHEFNRELHYDLHDIKLTENGALSPAATTTGMIIFHPQARYFSVRVE